MGYLPTFSIKRRLAVRLLAAASMLGIAAILSPGANAQETGSHISFTGAYLFNESASSAEFVDKFGDLASVDPGKDGYQEVSNSVSTITPNGTGASPGNFVFLKTDKEETEDHKATNDLDFQYFDVEFGYFPTDTNNVRLFAGLRVLNSENDVSFEDFEDKFGDFRKFSSGYLGIGPRVGFGAILPLDDSIFSFKANAAASVLFGNIKRTREFTDKFGNLR